MKVITDTHIILWALQENERLSSFQREVLANPAYKK
jgi:PIN domain nuclease of toxin-antitoxin system